jgi:hypothetical protein
LDARKEEQLFLSKDQSGDAIAAIEGEHRHVLAPDLPPTAVVSAGGTLPINTIFEYMYTITELGIESGPSVIVTAETSTGNQTVTIDNMVDLDIGGDYTGRMRKLYRRNQTKNGNFLLIDTEDASGGGDSFIDNGSVSTTYETSIFIEEGYRQRVRFWYTPGSDMTLELRYQTVPRRLQADADQPSWPPQYHQILVFTASHEIALQHGATTLSAIWKARGDEEQRKMEGKHLSREDRVNIRGSFDRHIGSNRGRERFGIPTKS